jgi:predicted phosphodiesterase
MEKVWFVPDVHRPFHDVRAWALMMKAMRAFKPDTICLIGDFGDFYAISSHIRSPKRRNMLKEEFADCNEGLDELDAIGAGRKIYVMGNHEDRMERYMREKAPELDGLVTIEEQCKLAKRNWEVVKYRDHTRIGKLYVTHDVGSSGKNAIWAALSTYERSIVTGHTHRLGYVVEGNAAGVCKVSTAFGWLGDVKQMDYMSKAKAMKEWALGFGYGYHDPKTGFVYLTPVPIVEYTCSVEGTVYSQARR